jgi:hypothetical protein
MANAKLTEQEWGVFVELAARLGIDLGGLPAGEVRFSTLESIGHQIGRAVAQRTTEKLTLLTAEQLTGPQPCPTCGRSCAIGYRERSLETIDGPIALKEPACHCSACRRDFFPSASSAGPRPTKLQSCRG